jgi:hypothetical protein
MMLQFLIPFLVSLFSFNEPIKALQNGETLKKQFLIRSRREKEDTAEAKQAAFLSNFLDLFLSNLPNFFAFLTQELKNAKIALQNASLKEVTLAYQSNEQFVAAFEKNKIFLEKELEKASGDDQKILYEALLLVDATLDYIRELKCLSVELQPDYEEVLEASFVELIKQTESEKSIFGKKALFDLFKK